MRPDIGLERRAAVVLSDDTGISPPERLIEDILATTGRVRPRPRWLALLKEPPMRIESRVAIGSPTARLMLILALTLALLVAASALAVGAASLVPRSAIVVAQDGSGTVTTIGDGIAMATDGDTILVRPGVYPESVTVTADITMRGEGPRDQVVIETPAEADPVDGLRYALVLDGTDATVAGLTLRGEHSRVLVRAGAPTLDGLVFESVDAAFGRGSNSNGALVIVDGSQALVRGGRFVDGGGISTFSSAPRFEANELINGPHIWIDQGDVGLPAGDPVFVDNLVQGALVQAVGIFEASNARFERNRFFDVPTAFELGGSVSAGIDPVIAGNTIKASSYGIRSLRDASPVIEGNDISGAAVAGIKMDSLHATVSGNRLHDNAIGIHVDGAAAPSIAGNAIEGNTTGISASMNATPVISDNRLCGNQVHLAVPEGSTLTLDGNTVCASGGGSPAPS